ncbi:AhpC/TSA antioxidant enzyme-domain-containing protein [Rhodocollybia butyracea]|uniref:AhpC/TSA antioxidant enzyme-domain-containing protein n=1 Tax=Rhodocollybia butyracea TaxID=206335 RepID=A0A9P5PA77_9AGAR|nr:AhpC/TSA antioxidant enzyme-domain-containing protein [Rhodocollybia butyracea]
MSANIPDNDTLSKASDLEVLDFEGKKVSFGSLFTERKMILVFIRHFFCGTPIRWQNCQQYVSKLNSEYEKLSNALEESNTGMALIGCGDWDLIEKYSEMTGFPSSRIYANPSLGVFHALGMNLQTLARTPAGQKKASYLTEGIVKVTLSSAWETLKNIRLFGKQGNIAQLGGEFIMGPGNQCTFAHRMQHTEDHAEIAQLLEGANLVKGS